MKNQIEEWVPMSDWGRDFLTYLNRPKEPARKATPQEAETKRQKKLARKNELARKRYTRKTPKRYCGCGRALNARNKHGFCFQCAEIKPFEYRKCACGKRLGNRNKNGACKACQIAALPDKRYCTDCKKLLHGTNKTGLCVHHSGIARQQSYLARRKAA